MIDADSMRILTTASAEGPILPRESIPVYARVAEALTEAIEQRFSLRTIQLALFKNAKERGYCAVHEIMGLRDAEPESYSFTELDRISSSEVAGDERTIILKIMRSETSEFGKFARLGWIDELFASIGSDRSRNSRPVVCQMNQGIDFCLLSVTDVTKRKVWFKAVGEPNTHEYRLTLELARRFPAFLPKILAAIPEWKGWVMEDVRGIPLNESNEIGRGEQALTALASMQQVMADDIASLWDLGARDWRCTRITSLSERFFSEAQCAMEAQTSTKLRPLAGSELYQLKNDVESALREFMSGSIPDTLLHGDIGHGNIIVSTGGPVFLDWAETYIGHPFLSAEHLLADLARSSQVFAEAQAGIRSHYAAHWKDYAKPAELERVTMLAPAIAAFAYAVHVWEVNWDRPDPTLAWPLMRSMLRRTRRELLLASEFIA
jgi:hypothetical protein